MTIAWLMPDEPSGVASQILDRVVVEGAIVPSLWTLEVGNTLLVAERRQRLTGSQRVAALRTLAELPISLDGDTAARAWGESMDLAESHGLTLYDATYLELAARRSLPLATFDAALRRAAQAVAIDLL